MKRLLLTKLLTTMHTFLPELPRKKRDKTVWFRYANEGPSGRAIYQMELVLRPRYRSSEAEGERV